MAEAITFWLDNKMSSGIKVAEIGSQALVSYRDKFYIVEKGAALMKGSRPLHYSKSSIPTIWRKVMRGVTVAAIDQKEEENMPMATSTKRERPKAKKEAPAPVETAEPLMPPPEAAQQEQKQVVPSKPVAERSQPKSVKSREAKPVAQASVTTACPYCGNKHEIPLEKGKNGKAFLMACLKCNSEFAIRFVPVTVYQAQVAAFS